MGKYEFTKASSDLDLRPVKTYKNGSKYLGQLKPDSNIREGQGVFVCLNGYIYEGDWRNDKRSGQGRIIYPDDSIYQGSWLNDKRYGKCTLVDHDCTRHLEE